MLVPAPFLPRASSRDVSIRPPFKVRRLGGLWFFFYKKKFEDTVEVDKIPIEEKKVRAKRACDVAAM